MNENSLIYFLHYVKFLTCLGTHYAHVYVIAAQPEEREKE